MLSDWRKVFACLLAMTVLQAASLALAASEDDGIAAYGAGDFEKAWSELAPLADAGSPLAQRYIGLMLLDGDAPASIDLGREAAFEYLSLAARAGDRIALIRLEQLRVETTDVDLGDIIAIEKSLAEDGDPVAAWRLFTRARNGEIRDVSQSDLSHWLEVAATANQGRYAKAGDAAFELCEMHVNDLDDPAEAKRWCEIAAEKGHTAARLVLRQFASQPS